MRPTNVPRGGSARGGPRGAIVSIVLLAIAGLLVGGAWSLYQQGVSKPLVALVGGLALLATLAGVMWL